MHALKDQNRRELPPSGVVVSPDALCLGNDGYFQPTLSHDELHTEVDSVHGAPTGKSVLSNLFFRDLRDNENAHTPNRRDIDRPVLPDETCDCAATPSGRQRR